MAITWIQRGLLAAAAVIIAVQAALSLGYPHGDFLCHWDDGLRMRLGIFEPGRHVPYPPAWAAAHVPLSLMPLGVAKASFLVLGVGSLIALLWMLHDLSKSVIPLADGRLFWVVAGTLIAGSRFVLRDLDDGGQNLFLFTLSWAGIWLMVKGRPYSGAASLGLAIALKLTAAIFVVYFLLKRQWKMALASMMWTVLFSLALPLPWLRPSGVYQHFRVWEGNLVRATEISDPSMGILGEEPIANKSLRPALARYFMHLPEGHEGRYAHRGYVDFLQLEPSQAGTIIKGIMLVGLLAMGWRLRRPMVAEDRQTFLWELAIVSVLMLLYSPITWGQHCIATLPAFYLILRGIGAGQLAVRRTAVLLLGVLAPIFITNRGIIGKDLSLLMESYHISTFALIGLIGVLFAVSRSAAHTVILKIPDADRARKAA